MGGEHLVLDPAIRDWVVFPLMLMVILVGVLRHNITALLKAEKPLDKEELSHKQTLTRAKRLRGNGRFICGEAFSRRKGYFTSKEGGLLRQEDLPGQANPMANPEKMMGPMKSQMGFVGTNMFMMAFTSYFFEGFVLVRVPFPLTNRFKVMLQRGVLLGTLDASYVSSTSWYFLVMFGLKSVINLFLRDAPAQDEAKVIQAQLGVGAASMGFDTKKIFASEADSLDLAPHDWFLNDVEKRLLGSKGVTMPDDTCQGRRLVEKVVTYMNKYVDFFANLCQQDYQFQRYRPSHIAAAAVLAARRALCIKPLWRDELTELTGYTVEDIVECGEELWNLYEEMFPSHRPLRTDASAALKKAAAAEQQEQQASGLASSADPHAPSSGSNPTMVVGNASGSAGGGVAVSGEDDSRTGYDASTA